MIGFAGQRVIKQTLGQDLPEGFQTAEFLLEHGAIEKISGNKVKQVVTVRTGVEQELSKKIVRMLRESGAREVHVRVSAPPVIGQCFNGIDLAEHLRVVVGGQRRLIVGPARRQHHEADPRVEIHEVGGVGDGDVGTALAQGARQRGPGGVVIATASRPSTRRISSRQSVNVASTPSPDRLDVATSSKRGLPCNESSSGSTLIAKRVRTTQINPTVTTIDVSARTGEGVDVDLFDSRFSLDLEIEVVGVGGGVERAHEAVNHVA